MLFLFFLLYSVLKIDQVTIFTIGLTGVGKSANGNAFIQKNGVFETSPYSESCTMNLQVGSNIVDGVMRHYIDTPGLESTDGNDLQNQIDMIKSFNNLDYGINAYFLVFNIHDPRMTESIKNMIILLNNYFNNSECWKQAGIIFTKCDHKSDEMPFLMIAAQRYRDNIIEFIKTLPNCEKIDIKLPCFFVNCIKWESDNETRKEYNKIYEFAKQFSPNVHNFQIPALTIKDSYDPKKVQDLVYKVKETGQKSIITTAFGKSRELSLDENGKIIIPIKMTLTQLYEYRLNWESVEPERSTIDVQANYDFERMMIFPIVPNQDLGTFIYHRKSGGFAQNIRRKTSRYSQELIIELGSGFVFKSNNSSRYVLNSPNIDPILSIDPKCPAYEKRENVAVPLYLEINMN